MRPNFKMRILRDYIFFIFYVFFYQNIKLIYFYVWNLISYCEDQKQVLIWFSIFCREVCVGKETQAFVTAAMCKHLIEFLWPYYWWPEHDPSILPKRTALILSLFPCAYNFSRCVRSGGDLRRHLQWSFFTHAERNTSNNNNEAWMTFLCVIFSALASVCVSSTHAFYIYGGLFFFIRAALLQCRI